MNYIVGIDEAGRGPLAGPVSVCAVVISKKFKSQFKKLMADIQGKDSKKLTKQQRELWFKKINYLKKQQALNFHVCLVSAKTIDTKGINFAIRKAIKMCLRKIKADSTRSLVLLDGSLGAPKEFLLQKTIIRGDETEAIISAASIVAKVTRDAFMIRMAKKYTEYSFEIHKGYGTQKHRALIVKYGLCPIHRKSFRCS